MIEAKAQEQNTEAETRALQLELTQEEKKIFVDILDTCLSDLRMEIGHTDRQDFKEILQHRKKVLLKVLDKLV